MTPQSIPPRILIAAENASRRMGGEAILPYHYFRILRARGVDTHLIVHERTREELTQLFPQDLDRLHFIADQPSQKLFFRLGKLLPRRVAEATFGLLTNLLTQRAQRPVLLQLATGHAVIHQPIPVSPRFPSALSGIAPLVLGPLNGGMEYPAAFRQSESWFSRAIVAGGRAASDAINALVPGKRRAAIVLVANERTRQALPHGLRGRIVTLCENAVDVGQWQIPSGASEPDRFVFIGRLVDWKALDLLLHALVRVPEAKLDVVGDGPMRPAWQALTEQLGLTGRVRFLGWQDQSRCAEHLGRAAALVLPSLYECGGAVVLEAMAMARPVIATAWGGPLDYLDSTCGILIEPTGREALIAGLAQAMRRLLMNPEYARALGQAGQLRARQHFDWEHKVDLMLQCYGSAGGRV